MRDIYLLLLIALTTLVESHNVLRQHGEQKVLVRTKRRWVLSTIELEEEQPGPYPKRISQMFNNMSGDNHLFKIRGDGVDREPVDTISIDPHNGIVYANRPIDREAYPKPFHIKFDIHDKYTDELLDRELAFDVEVKDINDNPPKFVAPVMIFDVNENTPEGYLPVQMPVTDRDQENTPNSKIIVTMLSQNPLEPNIGVKQMHGRLAQLTLAGCFDYDKIKKYEVVLQAKDHGDQPLSSTAVITLNIVDSNSHAPVFKIKEYDASVKESITQTDILRVSVDDLDTPNTPAWRAKYTIIEGNENHNYKIETDPKTNEGILSVIKAKDYERTTTANLKIQVENEEPLFVCPKKPKDPPDMAMIKVKVINLNDAPQFRTNPIKVFVHEEEEPGKVLLTSDAFDVDSDPSELRYEILDDPANWVTIDKKTGEVKAVKPMDRESPFLNGTDTYTILIGATDNGEPPGTGTCTVKIHVGDINDNLPQLASKGVVMCGNKENKVMVQAKDGDDPPFSGPFTFSLGGDDKTLEDKWKLDPAHGEECGIISRKSLPYGNYSVPLEIQDQQNTIGRETLVIMVCDCGQANTCRDKLPSSSSLGPAGIGLLFLGFLMFLLLLLLLVCECGKAFQHLPVIQEEGNQTLIKYNQEGGVSECKTEPTLFLTPTQSVDVTEGLKQGTMQKTQMSQIMTQDTSEYKSAAFSTMNSNMTSSNMVSMGQRDTMMSMGGQAMNSWSASRNSIVHGASSRRSANQWSSQHIADHIDRRLYEVDGNHEGYLQYQPQRYAYEGQGSKCQSLDGMSLSNLGDDLTFLNDLDPKFNSLAGICRSTLQGRKTQL